MINNCTYKYGYHRNLGSIWNGKTKMKIFILFWITCEKNLQLLENNLSNKHSFIDSTVIKNMDMALFE